MLKISGISAFCFSVTILQATIDACSLIRSQFNLGCYGAPSPRLAWLMEIFFIFLQ